MATQRRIRRLVIGALFLCLTICTLVVKQYVYALLLGSVTYWLILSGIFEAFTDEPDPETGRPMPKALVLAGLAFFYRHCRAVRLAEPDARADAQDRRGYPA